MVRAEVIVRGARGQGVQQRRPQRSADLLAGVDHGGGDLRKPVDRDFIVSIIEDVVLPAAYASWPRMDRSAD
jgi:hypothetical protein